jgi:hypothetical protein
MVLAVCAGCGGSESDESGELLRYEIEAGELDFSFDEPQDSVVQVPDAVFVVETDGRATYDFADEPTIHFRLSDAELSRLRSELDAIDFQRADEELSGPTTGESPKFSLTHDGTTVELGDEANEINYGEGPIVADQISDLEERLGRLLRRVPAVEKASDEYLRSLKRRG